MTELKSKSHFTNVLQTIPSLIFKDLNYPENNGSFLNKVL